jgi:hypothetical protein
VVGEEFESAATDAFDEFVGALARAHTPVRVEQAQVYARRVTHGTELLEVIRDRTIVSDAGFQANESTHEECMSPAHLSCVRSGA